jgi:cardiolipin synthase
MMRVRRLLWSSWVWTVVGVVALTAHYWLAAGIAAVVAFLAFLAAPAALAPRFGLDHEFDVTSEYFLDSVAGATGTPFLPGNRLELLNNGDAFYPAMLQAIQGAELSITIEAYIYWAGDIGREFARALAERAQAGVSVNILLDAIGSSTIGDEILQGLTRGGCQVIWYNPIDWYTIRRFNNRTHRKSLIIDGRIAFSGGAGIADHWRGNARGPAEWRDLQFRVEGPVVRQLQSGFAENWQKSTGELLSGPTFYPEIVPAGTLSAQMLLSSPETGGSSVRTLYYLSIVCARHSIFITNPYFVPDPVAIDTLVEAKERGVDVRIIVAGSHNDNALARYNTIRLYGRLLRAGIRILEYDKTMLHQKVMVVDGCWVTIGTTNFDYRSFAHNEESNVSFVDTSLATELVASFNDDALGCREVTLEAWRGRGFWSRLTEIGASLFEEQV